MTEFYQHEQETQEKNLSNQSSSSDMPSFYSSTRNHPLTTQHLTDHDDADNGMYKDTFMAHVIEHWKLRTIEHQHPTNDHFSQAFANQLSSTESTNTSIDFNLSNKNVPNTDKNSNKIELPTNVDESEKPMIAMKKRATPLPTSHARRKAIMKDSIILEDGSSSKLLSPHNKNKHGAGATKKTSKSAPIFIAPKKTPPTPHSFSTLSFDDSLQIKRKPILERQIAIADDQSSTSTTNWAPAPPSTPSRYYMQSLSGSHDDDEDSSDESDHGSLLIRNKRKNKKTHKIKDQHYNVSLPTYLNVPSAIFITDPNGHSHPFDTNNNIEEKLDSNEQLFDNDSHLLDTNTLGPDSVFDNSTPSNLVSITPTSPITLDRHTLHSIGEEEDEEGETNHDDGIIFSKELGRIQARTRTHQTNLNAQKEDKNQTQHIDDKEPLGRRWSDGGVDEEKERNSSKPIPLMKMASAASIIKQPTAPPVKISKTKYLLMKLHLTSSSKDDESNTSSPSPSTTTTPSKKRLVRRSSDKKRYQTQ